jgi:hypothetical protein
MEIFDRKTFHATVAGAKLLADLPLSFRNLASLKLVGLKLQRVPPAVFHIASLVVLSLTKNRIAELPAAIGNLTALQQLDMSFNHLSVLPVALLRCRSLISLNLYWNRFEQETSRENLRSILGRLEADRPSDAPPLPPLDLMLTSTDDEAKADEAKTESSKDGGMLMFVFLKKNPLFDALHPRTTRRRREMFPNAMKRSLLRLPADAAAKLSVPERTSAWSQLQPLARLTWLERTGRNYSTVPAVILTEPMLFLGSREQAESKVMLEKLGVTRVVRCISGGCGTVYGNGAKLLHIQLSDVALAKISAHFAESFRFIDVARKQRRRVFVHCEMGVSRSTTLVLAYLMQKRGLSLVDALHRWVKVRRERVRPNGGFIAQLRSFDTALQRARLAQANETNKSSTQVEAKQAKKKKKKQQ